MTKYAIVNVATGQYVAGQKRLKSEAPEWAGGCYFENRMPPGSPDHSEVPYAFKAWALETAAETWPVLLWCDACIRFPNEQRLRELFEMIEAVGYWIGRNGFSNGEWTEPSTLPLLGVTAAENETIEHVVATSFGVSVAHPIGHRILSEYVRLASNGSFKGPHRLRSGTRAGRQDSEVSGHRHDQTALSVIAHKVGCVLTSSPNWFSYKGGETEQTAAVADGAY